MHRKTKMLLSFFSLVGFAVLQLADDAGPQCSGVHPVAVTLEYATNCDTSDHSTHTGTIAFDLPSVDEGSQTPPVWEEKIIEQAKAGGLDVDGVVVNESCQEDGARASARSLSFVFSGQVRCGAVSFANPSDVECWAPDRGDSGQEPTCNLRTEVQE